MSAGSRLLGLVALAAIVTTQSVASAAEVTVKNDSTVGGTPSTVIASFLAGERVASWLTATCTGDIVAAQVYWASPLGGAPAQLEHSISFFQAGVHPTPGSLLVSGGVDPAVVVGPQLADGVMNEFRHLDPPADTKPIQVPVVAGQVFAVSLEFLNQSSGNPFAPAPVADQDGCQPLTNAAYVLPGGWSDACPLGVPGDWVIRAVIDCDVVAAPASGRFGRLVLVTALLALGAGALARIAVASRNTV